MERLVAASTAILVVDVQETLAAAMPEAAMDELAKNAGHRRLQGDLEAAQLSGTFWQTLRRNVMKP
jgi:hypothetical protein